MNDTDRIARIRERLGQRVPKGKRRPAAIEIGVSNTTLGDFIDGKGGPPLPATLDAYEAWLDGDVRSDRNGSAPAVRDCPELEEVLVEEIRRIAKLDEPESRKMLYRDSLASLMSRAWGIAAERAGEARALAVMRGDAAADRRAGLFGFEPTGKVKVAKMEQVLPETDAATGTNP